MALDRQSVEKKDFPISRRGYDAEAVDAHLARIAGEIDALKRQSAQQSSRGGGTESLALSASKHVQAIVEAAENSAADIEQTARDDADQIRSDARSDAAQTRDDAVSKSKEHVGKVSDATTLMLQRVDAMENELGALLESLRTGANRLNADLALLQGNMGELYGAAGGGAPEAPAAPPAMPEPVAAEPEPEPVAPEPEPEPVAAEPEPEPEPAVPEPAQPELTLEPEPEAVPAASEPLPSEPEPAAEPASGGDVEGARLIAFNMALNGQSREETDRYLADNFDLADRAGLIDEVYASIE